MDEIAYALFQISGIFVPTALVILDTKNCTKSDPHRTSGYLDLKGKADNFWRVKYVKLSSEGANQNRIEQNFLRGF